MSARVSVASVPLEDLVAPWFELAEKVDVALICPVCLTPANDPLLHFPSEQDCGRLICEPCKNDSVAKGKACPNCLLQLKPESLLTPASSVMEQLGNIKVKCTSCKATLPRKDFDEHIHGNKCRVLCPYGCRKKVSRGEWAEHDLECPEKPTPCPAGDVGCTFVGTRNELKHHNCPFLPIRHVLQKYQSDFTSMMVLIKSNESTIARLAGDLSATVEEVARANAVIATLKSEKESLHTEHVVLRRSMAADSEKRKSEHQTTVALLREQIDIEKIRVSSELERIRAKLEAEQKFRLRIEQEMREFRLSVMTDIKRETVEQSGNPIPAKKSEAVTLALETAGLFPRPSLSVTAQNESDGSDGELYRALERAIKEHEDRLTSLENMIQPIDNAHAFLALLEELATTEGAEWAEEDGWGEELEGENERVYARGGSEDHVESLPHDYDNIPHEILHEYLEAMKEHEEMREKEISEKQTEVNHGGDEMNDEDLLKELEVLREEYLQITQPENSDVSNNASLSAHVDIKENETHTEDEIALFEPNKSLSGPPQGRLNDSLDSLLDTLEKDENPSDLGVVPTSKAVQYVKERFRLQRPPSTRMVDYLMSLPPDSVAPQFDESEGVYAAVAQVNVVAQIKKNPSPLIRYSPSASPKTSNGPRGRRNSNESPTGRTGSLKNSRRPTILVQTSQGQFRLKFGKTKVAVVQLRPMRPTSSAPPVEAVKKEKKKYEKERKKIEKEKKKQRKSEKSVKGDEQGKLVKLTRAFKHTNTKDEVNSNGSGNNGGRRSLHKTPSMNRSSTQEDSSISFSTSRQSNQFTPVYSRPQSSIINAASSEMDDENDHADLITSILDGALPPQTPLSISPTSSAEAAHVEANSDNLGAGSMITDILDSLAPTLEPAQLTFATNKASQNEPAKEEEATPSTPLNAPMNEASDQSSKEHVPSVKGHRRRHSRVHQESKQHTKNESDTAEDSDAPSTSQRRTSSVKHALQ